MSLDVHDWVNQVIANGRYTVVAELGEGGMGFVYRGRDNNLETDIVIKVPRRAMLDVPGFAERFAREIRSLVKLQHPHVVKLIDVGEHDGLPFAVMQFLSGGDLNGRFPRGPAGERHPIPPLDVAAWLPDVAAALDFVHSQGYIHRDVKPANILFDTHGNVFLSDFGVARVVSESAEAGEKLTGTGLVLGTPEYMAPELIMGEPCDGRVDQYALAVMTYETLCGHVPYSGPTPAAVLVMQTTQVARPLNELFPSIPVAVSDAVMRGFAKNPADRFADCRGFADAVAKALSGADFVVEPGQAPSQPTVGFASTTRNLAPTKPAAVSQPRGRFRSIVIASSLFALDATLLGIGMLLLGILLIGFIEAARGRWAPTTDLAEIWDSKNTLLMIGGIGLVVGATMRAVAHFVGSRIATLVRPSAGLLRWGIRPLVALAFFGAFVVLAFEIASLNAIEIPAPADEATPSEEELVEAIPPAGHVDGSDFVNPLGMKMIAVTPGRYLDEHGGGATIEKPYWIAEREVSVAHYFTFLKDRQKQRGPGDQEHDPEGSRGEFAGFSAMPPDLLKKNGSPVVGITPRSAAAFCDWLSAGSSRVRYRLPTRGEWVCAYRGGTTTPYHWGDAFDPAKVNGHGAADRFEFIAPCGRFPGPGAAAHPWGLHDMAGNVWEMTGAESDDGRRASSAIDARGGAWNSNNPTAFSVQGEMRTFQPADSIGFRVVAELNSGD